MLWALIITSIRFLELIHIKTGSLYPFTLSITPSLSPWYIFPYPHPWVPGNHHSTLILSLAFLDSMGKWSVSSVAQSRMTLLNPMDHSMPGLPVHHQPPEFTQTPVHWVSDAIQPSHPLLFPYPAAFKLSQHQSLFQWVSSSHQVAKVLEFQLQHQSLQWIFRTDFL